VESIICTLLKFLALFSSTKNCENLLRFDKVTADYKAVPFFRTGCINVKLREFVFSLKWVICSRNHLQHLKYCENVGIPYLCPGSREELTELLRLLVGGKWACFSPKCYPTSAHRGEDGCPLWRIWNTPLPSFGPIQPSALSSFHWLPIFLFLQIIGKSIIQTTVKWWRKRSRTTQFWKSSFV